MSIISKETWKKFTEEEKKDLQEWYEELTKTPKVEHESVEILEEAFGKENLRPKPSIKTWDDVISNVPLTYDEDDGTYGIPVFDEYVLVRNVVPCSDDTKKKLEATYRISKIIELGYGGIVTSEEKQSDDVYYVIYPKCFSKEFIIANSILESVNGRDFVAFHNKKQAEEFLSHPKNIKLLKDYFQLAW